MLNLPNNSCIWLRTCYKSGSDNLHTKLLSLFDRDLADMVNTYMYGVEVSHILDDSSLYNYGSDWSRIFVRVPEVAQGMMGPIGEGSIKEVEHMVKDAQIEAVREFEEDEIEELQEPDYTKMQSLCVTNFLFVEDEEALNTGKVLIVWLDERGRIIRQCRIVPQDMEGPLGIQHSPAGYESSPAWLCGEVGVAYRRGGICGPPYAPDI